jgi:HPt (histidine-containing phosphotransfer) domain-containing protein
MSLRTMQSDPRRSRRFLELKRQFLEDASAGVAELTNLLDQAVCTRPDGAPAARFRRLAHGLRGAGGCYGFQEVTATAGVLEDAFLDGAMASELACALESLRSSLEAARFDCERSAADVDD